METATTANLGRKIKYERKKRKLTQVQLAKKIGKTESSVRKYEAGIITPPLSVVEQIAEVMGINVQDFINGEVNTGTIVTNTGSTIDFHIKTSKVRPNRQSEQENAMLQYFRQLFEENQDQALKYMEYLLFRQKTGPGETNTRPMTTEETLEWKNDQVQPSDHEDKK